jgi:UDP-N-acetylmuramate dehydrogenase
MEWIPMNDAFVQELKTILAEEQIYVQESMAGHTTLRIGGTTDVLVQPRTIEEVRQILRLCRQQDIPYYIIGNGSNLLVGDGGIRGVVIEFGRNFSSLQCDADGMLHVQAGCMLSTAANLALQQSLTGMEFAAGIPGTIGGAVMMNAGAYGGEMKDIVQSVVLMTQDGELVTRSGAEMEFGYRQSIVSRQNLIVLEVMLQLQPGEYGAIQSRMKELSEARRAKQPLEYPSAGSTFKRPEGYFAGKLIMDAGLAGYRVGDAQVSEKHCGFVINRGHATAKEFDTLMRDVSERVYQVYGVTLEPEVRRLGEFTE